MRVTISSLFLLYLNTVSTCELFRKFDLPGLFRPGDIMIGGIFPVFNKEISSTSTFESEPRGVKCAGFDLRAFRWTQVMIFAIEEINKDPTLLPNISLGYRILNSCASPRTALRAALTLAGGPEESEVNSCPPAVSALIAESGSSQSVAVASTLGPFQVPIVSYFSTCACLSDRAKYPTFFRTIPSDYFQAKALAVLVERFGWRWIGVIQSDDDYGRSGILAFTEEVKKLGVCIAFVGTILRTYTVERILHVVETIKRSTVRVIVAFVPEGDFYPLMKEIVKQNITGIQWIASEAWITASRPSTPEIYRAFGGALGFVVQKMAIPDLKPFLTGISPHADPHAAFVRDFWETLVGCRPVSPGKHTGTEATDGMCTGYETLMNSQDVFFDVTQLRVSYNVYKAVYAVAHALHQLVFCHLDNQQKTATPCLNLTEVQPKEVTHQLQRVNFRNKFGDRVFFDDNGDPPASYDIINWQLIDGQVQHVTLGHFTSTAHGGYELSIQEENIVWRTGKTVPTSLCSDVCPVGTRKAQIKGKPSCCFDCIPCADGTIANSTGADDCSPCPQAFWSNEGKAECIPKTVEFLTYDEPVGMAAAVVSVLGASLSLATLMLFTRFRETPVIKASNSELSCFLLFSLFLCFLCPLTFIGRPTAWTCMLRHTAFGVTFALCISCVLGKTIVVVTAFKATFPGNRFAGNFGRSQQRVIVCCCTLIQMMICALWLKFRPPFPDMVLTYGSKKIVLECNTGSEAAFYTVLGYIGILAATCLILAFLARKLPDNFNEAKFITFSMLIFCAVWIAFIPAYVSSPGKFTAAVEIFAILSSAFGLLISIFAPKCYIILIKPEKNTKKQVMGKTPNQKI